MRGPSGSWCKGLLCCAPESGTPESSRNRQSGPAATSLSSFPPSHPCSHEPAAAAHQPAVPQKGLPTLATSVYSDQVQFLATQPPAVMNLLLHISRQYPQKGRGTVFLVTNFAFVVAVLKASCPPCCRFVVLMVQC